MSRLDVHAHFIPDGYRQALEAAGHASPDGFLVIPVWDPAEHVAVMDRLEIDTALLSISSPGVHFGDDAAARALAREVNTIGREAALRHPGRFGLLAVVGGNLPAVCGVRTPERSRGHRSGDGGDRSSPRRGSSGRGTQRVVPGPLVGHDHGLVDLRHPKCGR
jgi:hypothetical protein